MADEPQYEDVQLVGRHIPDFQMNVDESGRLAKTELPGEYEVGVMFGKRFHSLARFQAGNVLKADGSHVHPADDQPAQEGETQA